MMALDPVVISIASWHKFQKENLLDMSFISTHTQHGKEKVFIWKIYMLLQIIDIKELALSYGVVL